MATEKRSNDLPKAKKPIGKGRTARATNKPVALPANNPTTGKTPAATAKPAKTTSNAKGQLRIRFQLRYRTSFGQTLFITGNHPQLGKGSADQALAMKYFNEESWYAEIDIDAASPAFTYNYLLKSADGSFTTDWGRDKTIDPTTITGKDLLVLDAWNYAGYFENAFYTEPFEQVLLHQRKAAKATSRKTTTHTFHVKAPLLQPHESLCLLGSDALLHDWDTTQPILMEPGAVNGHWSIAFNLNKAQFPIAYKYGIAETATGKFIRFEDGNNRVLYDAVAKDKQTIINDGFAVLPNTSWRGAGIAIPVFSIRTAKGFGVGEFADIPVLVDWAKHVGLKLVQILPVNDTTATHTWMDSYPYAAISAFALHPIYLNLEQVAGKQHKKAYDKLAAQQAALNALDAVDYEAVMKAKLDFVKKIFASEKTVLSSDDFKTYYAQNKHWLLPYAAFCYLRDEYGTCDFNQWPAYRHFNLADIEALAAETSAAYDAIAIHFFIQYHLHLQLQQAVAYAHANGIILKGDIPIGIYRYSVDAWQQPELYHMEYQAGAPPDDFAVKGQNWGFPTYNWAKMQEDGFAWWKQRFEQMRYYFDAFRIDHILGFFRIWSIPMHAVEGIMGHFVPALPVHINEFNSRGIYFDYHRYTQPFINDQVLWDVFGYDNETAKQYLDYNAFGQYSLKPEFATQRQVENHFAGVEQNDVNAKIKQGLFDLISNVLLFEAKDGKAQQFHFRFGMEGTLSFRYLDDGVKNQLKDLYVDYFFRRQDDFWQQQALQKLPALKRVTNMLICGEDLGLVPACVPDVMRDLGLLSLEIQRMPKDPKRTFFHPNDAPYLSVVTPSTHDMSTIRGWWEEDRSKTQEFYNKELGQWGEAPYYCEGWINKAIVIQHLYSPAMWSIFQLQDILGMSDALRRQDPNAERINVPANPKHYWRYRMHLSVEQLMQEKAFNDEFTGYVKASGR